MNWSFTFHGKEYRWRRWQSCNDPECGCGQECGEHEFHCSFGADSAFDARLRLDEYAEKSGCTIISAELISVHSF